MTHSTAVINAGFYTLQISNVAETRKPGMSQYCTDEKDLFQRLLPIIPKVRYILLFQKSY